MTEPNITPLARRLAEENGIDWRNLEGSGPDGTIVEKDILAFLARVMAGEVELPPQPEDEPPPEEIPDISQVQEALAREGVDLEELMPGITSENVPGEAATVEEEEVLFEMDFDEEITLDEEPLAPEPIETAPEIPEEPVEGYFAAEAPPEVAASEPAAAAPSPWESVPEPGDAAEQALEELEEEFSWEAAAEEAAAESAAAAEEAVPPFDESAGWELAEEPQPEVELDLEPEPEPELEAEPVAEPEPEPELPAEPEISAEEVAAAAAIPAAAAGLEAAAEEAAAEETGEAVEPISAAAVFPPAFRKAVSLEALEKARTDLSESWKKKVPTSLLLFRAVDRALAELEVPMRAVIGHLNGDQVEMFMVYPADNLRALFDHYLDAHEPADGLAVIDLGETPYAEIILSDTPLVTLGYAGMPEGTALLSISGDIPTDRARFLERVAFYLERPILLA